MMMYHVQRKAEGGNWETVYETMSDINAADFLRMKATDRAEYRLREEPLTEATLKELARKYAKAEAATADLFRGGRSAKTNADTHTS